MRTLMVVGIVTALVLGASLGFTQEHEHEDDAELGAAIDAIAAKYAEGWGAGDAAACAAAYTEDAVSVDLFGQTFNGRAAIQESIAQTLETYGSSSITIERTSLHVVNEGLVVSDGNWEVTGSSAEGAPTNGHYSIVATNASGEWLISHGQAKVAPPMMSQ